MSRSGTPRSTLQQLREQPPECLPPPSHARCLTGAERSRKGLSSANPWAFAQGKAARLERTPQQSRSRRSCSAEAGNEIHALTSKPRLWLPERACSNMCSWLQDQDQCRPSLCVFRQHSLFSASATCHNNDRASSVIAASTITSTPSMPSTCDLKVRMVRIPQQRHQQRQDSFTRIHSTPRCRICAPEGQQHVPHGRMHSRVLLINEAQNLRCQLCRIGTCECIRCPAGGSDG